MLDKFVKFPSTTIPEFLGFMLMVVASVAVAKRLPFVKTLL